MLFPNLSFTFQMLTVLPRPNAPGCINAVCPVCGRGGGGAADAIGDDEKGAGRAAGQVLGPLEMLRILRGTGGGVHAPARGGPSTTSAASGAGSGAGPAGQAVGAGSGAADHLGSGWWRSGSPRFKLGRGGLESERSL